VNSLRVRANPFQARQTSGDRTAKFTLKTAEVGGVVFSAFSRPGFGSFPETLEDREPERVVCGAAVSAGGLFESGCCAPSVCGASRCVSCTRRSPIPPPHVVMCSRLGSEFAVVFCQGRLRVSIRWRPFPGVVVLGVLTTIGFRVTSLLGGVLHVREPCVCGCTPMSRFVLCGMVLDCVWAFIALLEFGSFTTTLAYSPELSWNVLRVGRFSESAVVENRAIFISGLKTHRWWGVAAQSAGGLPQSGVCALSSLCAPMCVFCLLVCLHPPPTGPCEPNLVGSAVMFSRGASVRVDSAASGVWRFHTPCIASQGTYMGSPCARVGAGRPASSTALCAPRFGFDSCRFLVGVNSYAPGRRSLWSTPHQMTLLVP